MRMALLIVDVQEAFIGHRREDTDYKEVMDHINYSAALFETAELPVIVIRDVEEGDDDAHRNVAELEVTGDGDEVLKTYNNAFWRTDLDERLKAEEVDFVIICGNAAEYCVMATYNGAIERGYQAVLLQNGVLAKRQEGLLDLFYNRALISCTVLEGIVGFDL